MDELRLKFLNLPNMVLESLLKYILTRYVEHIVTPAIRPLPDHSLMSSLTLKRCLYFNKRRCVESSTL